MTDTSLTLPSDHPSSEFELSESALLTLWRTFWLVLPLAWGCEVDRFLYSWMPPTDIDANSVCSPVGCHRKSNVPGPVVAA
jgi:hypothetical protein